jgi:hypothetical protein
MISHASLIGFLADGTPLPSCRSPSFGESDLEFRIRLRLQPARVGRSVEISLLLEPAGFRTRQRLQHSSSLYFSLAIANQKDEHLSIKMDNNITDEAASSGDLADLLGFDHFMTFDLLMDTSAGYLLNQEVLICAHVQASSGDDSPVSLNAHEASTGVPWDSFSGDTASAEGSVSVRVAVEGDLLTHQGPGLVDFATVHEVCIHKNMLAADFRDILAVEFALDSCVIHPCCVNEREGDSHGNGIGCAHVRLQSPLSETQLLRNSVADLVRPLGIQLWHLIILPKHEGQENPSMLVLFFKFYDPASQSLEFIGRKSLDPMTLVSELAPIVNELLGFAPSDNLMGFDEAGGVIKPLPGDGAADVSLRDYGLENGAVLYYQRRLSAATRLQLLQESAHGNSNMSSPTVPARALTRPLLLPTIPSFISTFADHFHICLKPLSHFVALSHDDHVTITVPVGASCANLLAMIAARVCHERATGTIGCMLHKVVDHHVALQCPAVNCLWCRVHSSMDGRPRGSLSRGSRREEADGIVAKSLMVKQMLRLQARARRSLGLGLETPFVLYYEVTSSIHTPTCGALRVRWLSDSRILEVPVRQDSHACDVLSKLRQVRPSISSACSLSAFPLFSLRPM